MSDASPTDSIMEDDLQLQPTALATTIDNFLTTWMQLFAQITTSIGMVPPNEADMKESAEFSVKQFKDAGLELNGEFMQIAMEWRLKHPDEIFKEEAAKLKTAKEKQRVIIEKVAERLQELSK